jgi:hypothetical protein
MSSDRTGSTRLAVVVLEIIALLVVTPVVGAGIAALSGPENLVPGALFGATIGYFLAWLRRDTYGVTGR